MAQLVELNKHADEFRKLNAEVLIVFREEKEGGEGLKKIRERTKTPFQLAVDLGKKSTAKYSPKPGTFKNYVIDRNGVVRAVLPGRLTKRASAEKLLDVLRMIESDD